jgi:hypothetical protein
MNKKIGKSRVATSLEKRRTGNVVWNWESIGRCQLTETINKKIGS